MVHVEVLLPLNRWRVFGEIARVEPGQTRARNVRALSDCTLLQISGAAERKLSHRRPAFGFHQMELLAMRLGAGGLSRGVGQNGID